MICNCRPSANSPSRVTFDRHARRGGGFSSGFTEIPAPTRIVGLAASRRRSETDDELIPSAISSWGPVGDLVYRLGSLRPTRFPPSRFARYNVSSAAATSETGVGGIAPRRHQRGDSDRDGRVSPPRSVHALRDARSQPLRQNEGRFFVRARRGHTELIAAETCARSISRNSLRMAPATHRRAALPASCPCWSLTRFRPSRSTIKRDNGSR